MREPLTIILLTLLTAMGCSRKEDAVLPADPAKLVGNWVLISPRTDYNITLTVEQQDPLQPTPLLYSPQLDISGKGPVNHYSSSLTYAADSTSSARWRIQRWIRIDQPLTTTKIAENAAQIKESADYLRRLSGSYKYEVTEGGQLRLYYNSPWSSAMPIAGDDGLFVYQRQ